MEFTRLRHTGPWPARNDERAVRSWVESLVGGEDAESIARRLLDHVSNLDRGQRLMGFAYSESQLNSLAEWAEACAAGRPVQHVIGWTEFMGLRIHCDPRALVPRPETEELAHLVIQWSSETGATKLCDAGTGSGCLALALKFKLPHAEVFAFDASFAALELARYNAEVLKLDVEFAQRSFDQFGREVDVPFDCIVSNPPYIPENERSSMEDRVILHDPSEALFVPDEDPLVHYRAIVQSASRPQVLRPGGLLAFEVHEKLADEVATLMNGWRKVEVLADLQGKPRMVRGYSPLR